MSPAHTGSPHVKRQEIYRKSRGHDASLRERQRTGHYFDVSRADLATPEELSASQHIISKWSDKYPRNQGSLFCINQGNAHRPKQFACIDRNYLDTMQACRHATLTINEPQKSRSLEASLRRLQCRRQSRRTNEQHLTDISWDTDPSLTA